MVASGSRWIILLFTINLLYVSCLGGIFQQGINPITGLPFDFPPDNVPIDPFTGLPINDQQDLSSPAVTDTSAGPSKSKKKPTIVNSPQNKRESAKATIDVPTKDANIIDQKGNPSLVPGSDILPPGDPSWIPSGAGSDIWHQDGPGTWPSSGSSQDISLQAGPGPGPDTFSVLGTDLTGIGTDLVSQMSGIPGIDGVPTTGAFVNLAEKANNKPKIFKPNPHKDLGVPPKDVIHDLPPDASVIHEIPMDTGLPNTNVFEHDLLDPVVQTTADIHGSSGTGFEKLPPVPLPKDSQTGSGGQGDYGSRPDTTGFKVGDTHALKGDYGNRPDTTGIAVGDTQALTDAELGVLGLVETALNRYGRNRELRNRRNQKVFPRKRKGRKGKKKGAAASAGNTFVDLPGLGAVDFSSPAGDSSLPNVISNRNKRGRIFRRPNQRRNQKRLEKMRKRKQRQQQRQRRKQQGRRWKPAIDNPQAVQITLGEVVDTSVPGGGLITPIDTISSNPVDVGPAGNPNTFKRGGKTRRKTKPPKRRRIDGNRAKLAGAPKDVAVSGNGQAKPEPPGTQPGGIAEPPAEPGSATAEEDIMKIPGFGGIAIDWSTPFEGEVVASV